MATDNHRGHPRLPVSSCVDVPCGGTQLYVGDMAPDCRVAKNEKWASFPVGAINPGICRRSLPDIGRNIANLAEAGDRRLVVIRVHEAGQAEFRRCWPSTST